jgi:hypothetical protein
MIRPSIPAWKPENPFTEDRRGSPPPDAPSPVGARPGSRPGDGGKSLPRYGSAGTEARPRPGSYAWPELRQAAETAFAAGQPTGLAIAAFRRIHDNGAAHPPSPRTMRRWHTERRWMARAP